MEILRHHFFIFFAPENIPKHGEFSTPDFVWSQEANLSYSQSWRGLGTVDFPTVTIELKLFCSQKHLKFVVVYGTLKV